MSSEARIVLDDEFHRFARLFLLNDEKGKQCPEEHGDIRNASTHPSVTLFSRQRRTRAMANISAEIGFQPCHQAKVSIGDLDFHIGVGLPACCFRAESETNGALAVEDACHVGQIDLARRNRQCPSDARDVILPQVAFQAQMESMASDRPKCSSREQFSKFAGFGGAVTSPKHRLFCVRPPTHKLILQ